jgi:CDP-diacylglycerol--serine O-phosphatidyltransferase
MADLVNFGAYSMKKIISHIPNMFTAGNLFFGVWGITLILQPDPQLNNAFYCMIISAVFDFFDGFAARLLKVASPLGKELDSLADVVTFGVLPGLMLFTLYKQMAGEPEWPAYFTFTVPVFSAFRLAIFNLDETQREHFKGLATPANALFIGAIVCWVYDARFEFDYYAVAIPIVSVALSLLLVSRIPLLAFKFKTYRKKREWIKISFLVGSVVLAVFLKFAAAIIIFPLYFILSFIYFRINEIQSRN